MKKTKVKRIKKNLKKHKIHFIISLIILVVAASFITLGVYELTRNAKTIYLNDLMIQKNNIYKNAYIDIHFEPYLFAEYEDETTKFYIVQDDEYMYIAYLTESLYKKIINQDLEKETFKIEGYTKRIPDDVKTLAIEAYNEAAEKEIITDENFTLYFGDIYLDTTKIYKNYEIYFAVGGLLIIFGALRLIELNKSKKEAK